MKRFITLLIVALIIGLIITAGCVKKTVKPEPKPIVTEDKDVEEISGGISDISNVDEELDISDLENLEKELQDIEELI
ncbi:hypothetical protein DRJ17_01550 [Candidatus Woesearchaeota archaeon]|nr:MAG: hypothetical protein DRJ17_01550 [Candidatus Woesearchaeota archaeon]